MNENFLLFACFLIIACFPAGNTISTGDIKTAEKFCETQGGVDRYNTLFLNEVYCNDGSYLTLPNYFNRAE